MKFFAVAALAAASVATFVNADACPPTEILKLSQIIGKDFLLACEAETGYSFVPPPGLPTDEQVASMCLSDNCKTTIQTLKSYDLTDCEFTFSSGAVINVKQIVDSVGGTCGFTTRSLRQ